MSALINIARVADAARAAPIRITWTREQRGTTLRATVGECRVWIASDPDAATWSAHAAADSRDMRSSATASAFRLRTTDDAEDAIPSLVARVRRMLAAGSES